VITPLPRLGRGSASGGKHASRRGKSAWVGIFRGATGSELQENLENDSRQDSIQKGKAHGNRETPGETIEGAN